jgi:hypothetical protein
MRIHGTTRKRPLVVFENVEQATLLPLEKERFDPPFWGQYKVHPDHHVNFCKAFYSVPTRYVGKTAWVRGDSRLVRIYIGGELVKTHKRQPPGCVFRTYSDTCFGIIRTVVSVDVGQPFRSFGHPFRSFGHFGEGMGAG